MKIVPGPDFSTGGIIIAGDDLVQAYSTGKGKITLRARIHIEDGEYEKKNIVISELPYQVEKADLLQKILQLREAKKEILGGISDLSKCWCITSTSSETCLKNAAILT